MTLAKSLTLLKFLDLDSGTGSPSRPKFACRLAYACRTRNTGKAGPYGTFVAACPEGGDAGAADPAELLFALADARPKIADLGAWKKTLRERKVPEAVA